MDASKAVKEYFEKRADKLDSYYAKSQKPFMWRFLDFLFRRSMEARFRLTLDECSRGHQKILDVGCGSGRYMIALAERGSKEITGIDFSNAMIKKAHNLVYQNHVEDRCNFILGDFKDVTFYERFDTCLALGLFDYIKDPADYFKKMKSITKDKIIVSFPAKWRLRNLIRIVRLRFLGCPVYFYSSSTVHKFLKDLAVDNYEIKNLGRDYLVIAKLL